MEIQASNIKHEFLVAERRDHLFLFLCMLALFKELLILSDDCGFTEEVACGLSLVV